MREIKVYRNLKIDKAPEGDSIKTFMPAIVREVKTSRNGRCNNATQSQIKIYGSFIGPFCA